MAATCGICVREFGSGRSRACHGDCGCPMPTSSASGDMDVRPCAKRTAVGWRGAACPRSCSHGHDRHRQPRHDRRRAPGLRPDAGADGGACPADARRGAGRVAVDGPPGRHAAPRSHLVPVGRRGARRVLEARCGQGAQPAREPAADGRGRRPGGRLLGRADRGRGVVPGRDGRRPGRVLREVRGRARARAPRRRDLPRDLHPGDPHRPDALPPVARPRRRARPAAGARRRDACGAPAVRRCAPQRCRRAIPTRASPRSSRHARCAAPVWARRRRVPPGSGARPRQRAQPRQARRARRSRTSARSWAARSSAASADRPSSGGACGPR